jgi:transcriptional regulator with XRE-family HTH domain
MKNENTEQIRERTLALIESEFASDAAFERELGLAEKTVNNWRRGRSSSFMRMLPTLSERFGVNIGELLDMPLRHDTSELSEDELALLYLYRRARTLPQKMRTALRKTLETTIELYIETAKELKSKRKKSSKTH